MLIPLIFLCCLGCQQGEEVAAADVEVDIQAIKNIIAAEEAATNSANIDWPTYYGEETVSIPPNAPPSIGKEAILRSAQKMFEEMSPQEKDVVQDVQVSGNLAVAHVAWSGLITPKVGGEPFNANGNWILVFSRESGNSWKIIYSIWSDESLVHPNQAE
jgi:ketosteroid isomerase-like protein